MCYPSRMDDEREEIREPVIWGGRHGYECSRVWRAGRIPQTAIGRLRFIIGKSDYREWFLDWWLDDKPQDRQRRLSHVGIENFMAEQVRRHAGIELDFARLKWTAVPRDLELTYGAADDALLPPAPMFTFSDATGKAIPFPPGSHLGKQ